jgi:hypothetical protein
MAYMTMLPVVMMLLMMLRSNQMLYRSGACQSRDNGSLFFLQLCGLVQQSHELFLLSARVYVLAVALPAIYQLLPAQASAPDAIDHLRNGEYFKLYSEWSK